MSRPIFPGGSFNDEPVPDIPTVDDYIATVAGALFAPKASTEATLALKADKTALSISVTDKQFGAKGDDVTNDWPAFLAARNYAASLGRPVRIHIPAGRYRLNSVDVNGFRTFSGMTLAGDGYNNTILTWNDDAGICLFRGPTSGRASDVILEDFTIQGTQDTRGNSTSMPILITSTDNLLIRGLLLEKSRLFGLAIRGSKNVVVRDCIVRLCGRDGINVAQCTRYAILDNYIEHCDDDAIGAHTDTGDAETVPNVGVISGNRIFDAQGIKVLGARNVTISDNSLDCPKSQGISVITIAHDNVSTEGVNAAFAVVITGNAISNPLDRTAIDNLTQNNPAIFIGGASAQAGALAAVPGVNAVATGTIVPFYENLDANAKETTVATPGSGSILVANNTISRTYKGGVPFSSYGRGLIFSRGGWYDPTFTDTQMGSSGIAISGGVLFNVQIAGNVISGMVDGLSISGSATTKIMGLTFRENSLWDIQSRGVLLNITGGGWCRGYVINNLFDMDPLHDHTNRGPNGTWLASGSPTAVQLQSGAGLVVKGNTFRNLCRDTDRDSSADNGLFLWEDNLLEADPAVTTAFSTANKGVGLARFHAGTRLIYTDSDPASAAYGQTLHYNPEHAKAMPTSGKWLIGAFVRNSTPTVSAGKVVLGWYRLTNGSAHVAGTDWTPVYGTTS